MSEAVVLLRPFSFEKSLGLPISKLLLPIPAERRSSVVPDNRTRVEADVPTLLLQPPAKIHIVTGG
ncbi:MAG TPA: hypothetical protein VIL33_03205, partial [Rhodothermia bacterium]